MQRYIVVRLFQAVLTLYLLVTFVFVMVRFTGDPAELMTPIYATREEVMQVRATFGLDKPVPVQYVYFIRGALKGDFGNSIISGQPAMETILHRLPNSLKLTAVSMLVAILLAFFLGIVAAATKGSRLDIGARLFAVLGQSLPMFLTGIVLIIVFAVKLHILPAMGMGGIKSYILPVFTLAWYLQPAILRLLRSSMLDVLDSEYITFARCKGVSEVNIICKHALRNAVLPVVTFGGLYFGILVSGAVVIEAVFAWPGVGLLLYQAILARDFPVVQAAVLMTAAIVILANLGTDLLYAYIDPRIRY